MTSARTGSYRRSAGIAVVSQDLFGTMPGALGRITGRCKRLALLAVLITAPTVPLPAHGEPIRYALDPEHLTIAFLVDHIGFAKTLGIFREASGSFVFDESIPAVSDIDISINAASVFTNHEARDEHLRKEDFLWVARFPVIRFTGISSKQTGPRTGTVTGELGLRGVTRPVTLTVVWNRTASYPFGDKHEAVGISARTRFRRSEFGMTYAVANEWVGDEVEVIIEFEAIRQ